VCDVIREFMRRGVVIKTVIRPDLRRRHHRPHAAGRSGRVIAFMAATAQAQAEATKAAQQAGIEHAKANEDRVYLGRKPSFTRRQFEQARELLARETAGIAQIARDTGLTRQTIYRIQDDPAGAEAALAA
jgi:putative DNA-invertase from lambdoid prophage Rac